MAVGEIIFPVNACLTNKDSGGQYEILNHTAALLMDDSSTEIIWTPELIMPATYGSNLACDIYYTMASATTGDTTWQVRTMAVTDGDSEDLDVDSGDITAGVTDTVPSVAGRLAVVTVDMSSDADGLAAGDWVAFQIWRVGGDVGDDASGDAEVRCFRIYWDEA